MSTRTLISATLATGFAAVVAFAVPTAAEARQGGSAVRVERNMSLALANDLAAAAVASCQAAGYAVSATVVDRSGTVRAVQRADLAGPHTLEASRMKAWTSASARNTTLAMMLASQQNPAAANLVHIPGYLLLGGGMPVRSGDEVIGAIGVGGAPGGHLDEQCAKAALDQAADELK